MEGNRVLALAAALNMAVDVSLKRRVWVQEGSWEIITDWFLCLPDSDWFMGEVTLASSVVFQNLDYFQLKQP